MNPPVTTAGGDRGAAARKRLPPTVLFVCLHGSAKSLIAAERFLRLAQARGLDVSAASAGLEPDVDIPPRVAAGLSDDGIEIAGQIPKLVNREELASASRVVSFGCELSRLAPPGTAIDRWDDVPAVSDGYVAAREAIVARVARLVDACERERVLPPGAPKH